MEATTFEKHEKRHFKYMKKEKHGMKEESIWGPKEDPVKAVFAIVRHGERADNAVWKNVKYDIPFDPPITDEGIA